MNRLYTVLLVIFVLAVLLLLALGSFHLHAQGMLEDEQQAMRDAEFWTDPFEVHEWYLANTDPRVAEGYLDAMRHLRTIASVFPPPEDEAAADEDEYFEDFPVDHSEKESKLLPIVGMMEKYPKDHEPFSQETMALIPQFLEGNREALRLAHKAAKRDGAGRYPADYTKGFGAMLPSLGPIRGLSNVLVLAALYHSEVGQSEQAVRSLETASKLARSLNKEPTLVGQLVRSACHALLIGQISRTANRAKLTDDELTRLMTLMQRVDLPDAFANAVAVEAALMQPYYSSRELIDQIGNERVAFFRMTGLMTMNAAMHLKYVREQAIAMRGPHHTRHHAAAAVDDEVDQLGDAYIILKMLYPFPGRAALIDTRMVAAARATEVGLAVLRYQLKHGKLPATLTELVPDQIDKLPDDPMTGKPLLYKVDHQTGTFAVYSTGEDGTDNDAVLVNTDNVQYEAGADIPFTVLGESDKTVTK